MKNNFYYYISNDSSLGIIKKGTGVSITKENAIINYIVYGMSKHNAPELTITKEKASTKYEMSQIDMNRLENNADNCYLHLIRKQDGLVNDNLLLTKDTTVALKIQITDIINNVKELVNISEVKTEMPVKITKEKEKPKVSTLELMFYAKDLLCDLYNDIFKREIIDETEPSDYVFDGNDDKDYDEDDIYIREYIKIKNNKAS